MVTSPIFDPLLGVILYLTLVHSAGAQGLSSVAVHPSGQVLSPHGTNFTLSCFLNTSLATFLHNDVNWIYVSNTVSNRTEETILSERTVLRVNNSRYRLNVAIPPGPLYFNLTILNAMGSDDGRYICRLHKIAQANSPTSDEDSVSVIVPNDVEEVDIKLGDIVYGQSVSVTCTARGSNPPPVIDFYLSDKPVTDTVREVTQLEINQSAPAWGPRYNSVLRLDIPVTALTTIRCSARANYTGAKVVTAREVTFHTQHKCVVAPPVPQVGDVDVNISCEVLQDTVHLEDYAWEIKSGDSLMIRLTSNYTGSIYTTGMQHVNRTYTLVSLQLAKMDKQHLGAQYMLLLYTSLGAEERYLIQLVSGDTSGGATWTGLRSLWLAFTLCWLCDYIGAV